MRLCQEGFVSTTLYRFYDRDGRLLYVGITEKAWQRFKSHQRSKEWWTDSERAHLEHFETRKEAMRAELHAIKTERPLFNIMGQELSGNWSPDFELIYRAEPALAECIKVARGIGDPWDAPLCQHNIEQPEAFGILEDTVCMVVGPRRHKFVAEGDLHSIGDLLVDADVRELIESAIGLTAIEDYLRSPWTMKRALDVVANQTPPCIPGCCRNSSDDWRDWL